jgi:hypothetical protein
MGVQVTAQRTRREFAEAMHDLLAAYPAAEQITVVLDNLNTHQPGAFYRRYPPPEALAMMQRIHFVHTPVHGSWLNQAEIAISVLSRAVLKGQRFPSQLELDAAVQAWMTAHNHHPTPFTWGFTVDKARAVMPHSYPTI